MRGVLMVEQKGGSSADWTVAWMGLSWAEKKVLSWVVKTAAKTVEMLDF